MAYSKTPDYNTHQTKQIPIQGSTYNSAVNGKLSGITDTVRYADCYPVKSAQFGGPDKYYVVKRPLMGTYTPVITSDVIRGFDILGNTVGYVDSTRFWWSPSQWITKNYTSPATYLPQSNQYNHIFYYIYGNTSYHCCLEHDPANLANSHLLLADPSTGTTSDIDLGFIGKGNAVILDGYIFVAVFSDPGTFSQRIRNCAIGDPTNWPSTNFIDAEQYPDELWYIKYYKNYLLSFGQKSIEFFYDAAVELGSPLQRQIAYSTPITCYQKSAAQFCYIGEDLVFIGKETPTNNNGIYYIRNFKVEQYKQPYLERLINNTFVQIKGLFSIQVNGQTFCLLYLIGSDLKDYYFVFDLDDSWVATLTFKDLYISPNAEPSVTYPLWICTNDLSNNTVFIFDKGTIQSGSPSFYKMYSDDGGAVETVFAKYTTDLIDFDTQRLKSFNYIDVVGDFGSNSIKLEYTRKDDYSTFISTETKMQTQGYPLRYRNLGGSRKIAARISVSGTDQMRLDGLEITYNLGLT